MADRMAGELLRPLRLPSLLLLLLHVPRVVLVTPPTFRAAIDGDQSGGFVAESWGITSKLAAHGPDGIAVQDNNRLFATQTLNEPEWGTVAYRRFDLLDRDLTFDIDLSGVQCGCNGTCPLEATVDRSQCNLTHAIRRPRNTPTRILLSRARACPGAVYLVRMGSPNQWEPNYCDINSSPSCLEIDLMEGNAKAVQATLHTALGHGADGHSCNQDGCVARLGKDAATKHLYGPMSRGIDSGRPFTVSATFRETAEPGGQRGALYDVTLIQSGAVPGTDRRVHFFDPYAVGGISASGRPAPIPSGDRVRMREALLGCASCVDPCSPSAAPNAHTFMQSACAVRQENGSRRVALDGGRSELAGRRMRRLCMLHSRAI